MYEVLRALLVVVAPSDTGRRRSGRDVRGSEMDEAAREHIIAVLTESANGSWPSGDAS
jgi:hypothetical protein